MIKENSSEESESIEDFRRSDVEFNVTLQPDLLKWEMKEMIAKAVMRGPRSDSAFFLSVIMVRRLTYVFLFISACLGFLGLRNLWYGNHLWDPAYIPILALLLLSGIASAFTTSAGYADVNLISWVRSDASETYAQIEQKLSRILNERMMKRKDFAAIDKGIHANAKVSINDYVLQFADSLVLSSKLHAHWQNADDVQATHVQQARESILEIGRKESRSWQFTFGIGIALLTFSVTQILTEYSSLAPRLGYIVAYCAASIVATAIVTWAKMKR